MSSTPPEALKLFHDMRDACSYVLDFTRGKSLKDYLGDRQLRSAVERQFMIVGEALHQLSKAHPALAKEAPEARDIINFRHILVHAYERVEDETVWGIVLNDVQPLITFLNERIDDAGR